MTRPKIEYPCEWLYKIIGQDQKEMEQAVKETLANNSYQTSFSRKSSKGKYTCLELKTFVENPEQRDKIYKDILNHPAVKIVL